MSRGAGRALADLVWSLLRVNRPTVPVGVGRGDGVRLSDSPPLWHLADAIDGGQELVAADLLRRELRFVAAPDPTGWLRDTCRGNPPPTPDSVPLRVLTWNLALLDVLVAGRPYRQSPWVRERREGVFARLLSSGADIVLLQELWHAPEIQALGERAPAAGYRLCCPPRRHVDGLAVLLREEVLAGEPEVEVHAYGHQDRLEALDLPRKDRIHRSWLRVGFVHPALGPLSVFDTHLQAYPHAWKHRLHQSRALGLAVARRPADELVLVGGDLNAGAFYGRQAWRRPGGGIDSAWWHDALSLPALHHYGGLVDLAIRGRPLAEADLEVRLGRALDNDPEAALRGGLGCSEEHLRAYTATDCNRLYHRQYAGTEQPARLDHLLARDPAGRIHVAGSRHRFTERDLDVGGEQVEASDHYGVEVDLAVAPPT